MLNNALIKPESIAVVGASNNAGKPAGRLIINLLDSKYKGHIYPVNPKEKEIHGLKCYNSIKNLPDTDMAVVALHPVECVEAVKELAQKKHTRAFIVISAGFAETGEEGRKLEEYLSVLAQKYKLNIIGPNCIGVLNENYNAIFISSVPSIKKGGIDFVSASGALAVFVFEMAPKYGLTFNSIFSIGNSVQIGIEEILQYWDESFISTESGLVKVVYAEQIRKPELFFKHVHSLRKKGCFVIVLKPGESEAGERAALSHTGSMAGDKEAYRYLLQKAGAIQCYSRQEIVYLSNILSQPLLNGKNLAVITHAGGPAVMLSDQLQKEGFNIPELSMESQEKLTEVLHPGSSVHNPIDMLSTASHEQLAYTINYCNQLDTVDGMIVIYGKTGLEDLFETFTTMHKAIEKCNKPVYAVLPSVSSGNEEIKHFINLGHVVYSDEVLLAKCLGIAYNVPDISEKEIYFPAESGKEKINKILSEEEMLERLKICGIPYAHTYMATSMQELHDLKTISYPVVMKVMGILHKTEHNGVILNINNIDELIKAFKKLMGIKGATGVLIQEMLEGTELYIGAKKHPGIGWSVHAGIGGIFVELLEDKVSTLAPVDCQEAMQLLSKLKAQKLFEGFRNKTPVNREVFARLLVTFSHIFSKYPDTKEIDLNPLIANGNRIVAVDARIITEVPQT